MRLSLSRKSQSRTYRHVEALHLGPRFSYRLRQRSAQLMIENTKYGDINPVCNGRRNSSRKGSIGNIDKFEINTNVELF